MNYLTFDRKEHIYASTAFAELAKDAVRFCNGTPVHTLPPYGKSVMKTLELFSGAGGLAKGLELAGFQHVNFPDYKPKFGLDWQLHLQLLRKLKYETHQGLKYKVAYQLVNAADYGVPQSRERVFMVGIRADLDVEWAFPAPTHSDSRLLWDKFVTGEYWDKHGLAHDQREQPNAATQKQVNALKTRYGLFPPALKPWQTVRDALGNLSDPRSDHAIPDHIFRDGARVYPGHTGSDHDLPAKTLKAGGHGVPGGENMLRYRDGSVRYFTVHEAKLLQTFPADFYIEGAWGEAMRQIGNAVPVHLSQTLGKALRTTLQQAKPAFEQAMPLAYGAVG